MRSFTRMGIGLVGGLLAAGCRASTRLVEVPRVDLGLEGGNRGYLVGTAPEPAQLKATRQMVEATVELPSLYQPRRPGAPISLEAIAPPQREPDMAQAPVVAGAPGRYDTYVVQKGDSLWSIAAKPEVYGRATRWRRIFDANRDQLDSPDDLKAGMTLKIPRDEERGAVTYDEQGTVTYKK